MNSLHRRSFLRSLGLSASVLPFAVGLRSLWAQSGSRPLPAQRIIFLFSPNGTVPNHFWPDQSGENFAFKRILAPLDPLKHRTLILKGICNKVRGDGDGHMRGMSCLLTAIELLPGNIQGGSDKPAGWASGISIDQELKNFLQANPATRTRFGSLELGIGVPNRADPWTRWTYAGSNQPLPPMSDPTQVYEKLYGTMKDRENLCSVLDPVRDDLRALAKRVSGEDRLLLDKHVSFVADLARQLQDSGQPDLRHPAPVLEPVVGTENDDLPRVFSIQSDLVVNAFANDLARIATLQFTNSVGQARFRWLGIEEGHHSLSHDPDLNDGSQEKLVKMNTWLCEQMVGLARKLEATPDASGQGSLLDHTTILWTNELGKGNSHTLENIPFVLVGGGLGFKTGQFRQFEKVAHNRLWLSIAHAFGHRLETFGNPRLSEGGPLSLG